MNQEPPQLEQGANPYASPLTETAEGKPAHGNAAGEKRSFREQALLALAIYLGACLGYLGGFYGPVLVYLYFQNANGLEPGRIEEIAMLAMVSGLVMAYVGATRMQRGMRSLLGKN